METPDYELFHESHYNEGEYTEDDYYALPENVRVELIKGRFYDMAAPNRIHQKILNAINNTIYNHIRSKNGKCEIYPAPFAVKLFDDRRTIVEPDISVICDRKKLTNQGCSGAPDWIIEITSPSNPGHDYVLKLNLYMDAGVGEYWIVNPKDNSIFVYHFEQCEFYNVHTYTFQDKVKSALLEGLEIDFNKLEL